MTFGGLTAVDEVSGAVRRGEILGLIGPNGAGKTTLFNVITGFLSPTRGEVRFAGRRISDQPPHAICRLGVARTFQIVKPLAQMTVLENVMVGALLRTPDLGEAAERARRSLDSVRLDQKAGAPAGALTLGERKRLEMARALATQPTLLCLDEVMGGLNPAEIAQMIELIRRLRAEQTLTLLIIEHHMKAIMSLSDRVMVLNSGAQLAEGTPEEIARNPAVIEAYLGDKE